MASIAVRVRVPGLADQSVGVRVRMLRRGPDLQDTAPSPSPQNLLPTFLLSLWQIGWSPFLNWDVALRRLEFARCAFGLVPIDHETTLPSKQSSTGER